MNDAMDKAPALPTPKRYILEPLGYDLHYPRAFLYTDKEVADFVATLAPIREVQHLHSVFCVEIDHRYAYSLSAFMQIIAWLESELSAEFGGSHIPPKPQPE